MCGRCGEGKGAIAIDDVVATMDAGWSLSVRLLGGTEVRRRGDLVEEFGPGRLQSLLGFLVVHRERAVPRQQLAFAFWPDSTEGQARTNLRQLLHHLRRALPELDLVVRADPTWLQWRADAPVAVDLVEFEALAAHALASTSVELLWQASRSYCGELLAGNYDEWVQAPRAQLHRTAIALAARLVEVSTERGDDKGAIAALERWLELDPLDEAVYRELMLAHLRRGDRLRALRVFHACASVLEQELAVSPDSATLAVHQAVLASARTAEPVVAPAGERLVRAAPRTSALVARVDELDRLATALRRAREGGPTVVVIIGEPGVGKSRLVAEVGAYAVPGEVVLDMRGDEVAGDVPYGPIVEMLRFEPVRRAIDSLAPVWRTHLARLLPEVDPAADTVGSHATDPGEARRLLHDAICLALWGAGGTVVAVLDDLHWCDDATLEVVEHLVRHADRGHLSLLVVATVRSEELAAQTRLRAFVARLHRVGVVDEVPLARLAPDDARRLAASLLGPDVDEPAVQLVVDASEGNPLFIVELARAVDSNAPAVAPSDVELTPRLRAVIAQRLAALSPNAATAVGAASAIGRLFDVDVLAGCAGTGIDVVRALDELWVRGIVRHVGSDRYDFTHDKLREVAYASVPPAQCRQLHRRIATVLAGRPAGLDDESAVIAAHFIRAGAAAEAIAHVRRAVELAARRLASGDVIARCRTGLALLAALPDGPGRDEHEVGFLVPLGVALLAGPGIVDDDVAVYERARELHRRLGRADDPSTLRVLANALIPRRRFEAARQIGEALLARADEDELLATEGHYLVGATSFWLGELERSRGHLELALTSYQPARRHEHLRRFAQDPGAVCLCRLALTDAHLGHGALARGLTAQAIAAAGSGGHPYTEIYVGFFGGWALAEVGDIGAGAALALASKAAPDNLFGRVSQALFTAWAQLARGDYAAAVATFDTAIGLMGHHLSMNEPLALVLQADSHRRAGNPAAGIPLAARAVEIATTEMPIHLAEAHRLLGELELAVGRRDDGLGHLTYAAATAQAQHNVLHGARAHLAIARATNDLDRRAWAAARHDFDAWRRRHAKGCDLAELDEAAALFAHSTTTERP